MHCSTSTRHGLFIFTSFPKRPDCCWWLSHRQTLASDVDRQARDEHNRRALGGLYGRRSGIYTG